MDTVTRPEHYRKGTIEAIDYIRSSLGRDLFLGYLEGNVKKYLHRWRYKNGVEDLMKASWYLDLMIRETGDGSDKA